jgi:type I restriction-modification system DNA methylase subunit
MSNKIDRTKERIKQTGEVFTPLELVDEILNQLPQELFEDPTKTFLDPSCGDGNFLVRVVAYKIENGSTIEEALSTTYGVELMPDNVQHCKERLLALADNYDTEIHGIAKARQKYGHIVDNNIVEADALRYHYRFDGSPPYDPTPEEKQEEIFNSLFD